MICFVFLYIITAYSGLYVMDMIYSLGMFVPELLRNDTPTSPPSR